MKIIILGAGQVGSSVAANLCSEANDITVIDSNPACLQQLQDRFDLRTVAGHASHPQVLARAGAQDADMIIAVTNSDETNMIACQVAYTLFHTPTKIARIREHQYQQHPELFSQEALPIDVLISPEQEVTDYTQRLIEFPGALQVLDFANGKVQLVAARAFYGGPLVGHRLRELPDQLPGIETRVTAIFRRHEVIIPGGDTIIEAGDDVFFIAAPKHIRAVMSEFRKLDGPNRRVIIAGGGNIGKRLAQALEKSCHIKIIESNETRASAIAEDLKHAYVQLGDAADEDLLREENIENTDVFCALTNADEANIISSMLAKRLGAKTVMA
ncbi:MAG: Trk system potassium transporter TrkA, partial [Gammaproteobacteria bacterium]